MIVCCILTDVTSSGSRQQLLPEVVEPKQQKLESIIHKFVACMACQKQCIEGIVPSIFHLTNHFRFPQIIWCWKVFRLIICVCLTNFSIWSHCYITYLGVLYCACTSLKKVWRNNKYLSFTHSLYNYDLTIYYHIGFVHYTWATKAECLVHTCFYQEPNLEIYLVTSKLSKLLWTIKKF